MTPNETPTTFECLLSLLIINATVFAMIIMVLSVSESIF